MQECERCENYYWCSCEEMDSDSCPVKNSMQVQHTFKKNKIDNYLKYKVELTNQLERYEVNNYAEKCL